MSAAPPRSATGGAARDASAANAGVDGERPATVEPTLVNSRCEIFDASGPAREAEGAHRTIHVTFAAYEQAAERLRHPPGEGGEAPEDGIARRVAAEGRGRKASKVDTGKLGCAAERAPSMLTQP